MKTNTKIVLGIALGIAIGYFIFRSQPEIVTNTVTTTDTIYKDTGSVKVVEVPKIIKSDPDTVWKHYPVDTGAILAEYFTRNTYKKDTTINEVNLNYKAVVFRNKLVLFEYELQNLRVSQLNQTINNTTVIPYKVYLGGGLMGSESSLDIFGSVTYLKGRMAYNGGFGYPSKTVFVGVQYGL